MSSASPIDLPAAYARVGPHDAYPWQPLPWPGLYTKLLYFDRATGAAMELSRLEQGAEFPEHYHTTFQALYLVSGLMRSRAGALIRPGTFNVVPAGQVHGPFYAVEESIQFGTFSGVPVYVLPDGHCFTYREDGRCVDLGTLATGPLAGLPNLFR